ncbi:hypothetical protein ACTXT7_017076, partial [Hymenolepis weldensis]
MFSRKDAYKKNRKSPKEKKNGQTTQFNPDTTGLDSRGRQLKWSGDLSKVQVNLNNIFVRNAVSFAPSLRIHPLPSTSKDSTSRKDKTLESIEESLAKFRNLKECQTQQYKRKHEELKETTQLPQKDCSKYPPEPTVSNQGQDEEKMEEESEQSTLAQPSVSNSKSESHCDQGSSDEDEFDRRIMFISL